MKNGIQVSFIYKNQIKRSIINLSGDISAAMLIGAALTVNALLLEGETVNAADFVLFDMETAAEIHVNSSSLQSIAKVGFYPKVQDFMVDATPEKFVKVFNFIPLG